MEEDTWFRIRTAWGDFTARLGKMGVRELSFPLRPGARVPRWLPEASSAGGKIGNLLAGALERRLAGEALGAVPAPDLPTQSGPGVWYVDGTGLDGGLPLAPDFPSEFVQDVCRELLRIPPGQTRTYGMIAAALGKPRAARAVGRACGVNPVCVFIPCHRVVSAGGIGGFSAHIWFKRRLLAAEGVDIACRSGSGKISGPR
ncbi:MAG: MGMT family protein [Planctomycetota bacterium]|nr:MGMT family protein [Planctomycetota bacterium]